MRELSHYDLNLLFHETGAIGIRHRANRAIYERVKDNKLAAQLDFTAKEIETNPAHRPVAVELRNLATQLRDTAAPDTRLRLLIPQMQNKITPTLLRTEGNR